jgi:hypothetical protein
MRKIILLFLTYCFTSLYAQNYVTSANHKDCKIAYSLPNLNNLIVTKSYGEGDDLNEVPTQSCFQTFTPSNTVVESGSFWFKMTCIQSGSFVFTATPKVLTDDLDFIVFEAIGGDCTKKSIVRCVASGDNGTKSGCSGAVGLNFTSTDLSEPPGCSDGNDSFVKALDMKKGETYIVMINVFNGGVNNFYTIAFDGTAKIMNTTETQDLENKTINIYPSIASLPSFEVDLGQININNAQLEVFDLAGKNIFQAILTSAQSHIELPESTKNGLYVVKITHNRQVSNRKFILAR